MLKRAILTNSCRQRRRKPNKLALLPAGPPTLYATIGPTGVVRELKFNLKWSSLTRTTANRATYRVEDDSEVQARLKCVFLIPVVFFVFNGLWLGDKIFLSRRTTSVWGVCVWPTTNRTFPFLPILQDNISLSNVPFPIPISIPAGPRWSLTGSQATCECGSRH